MSTEATKAEAGGSSVEPEGGEVLGIPSFGDTMGGLIAPLTHGRTVAKEAVRLGGELARVVAGRSEVAPARGDRRFSDPAWSGNPLFQRLQRGYLAASGALTNVVEQYAEGTDDTQRVEQARFASTILISALAPTNYLPTNPAALKKAFDTGGRSLVRGLGQFVDDLRHNGGMPKMVDTDAFEVGRNLALTPGAVIERNPLGEVLHYQPVTEQVSARPLLIIPPPINRFYVVDLSPGRSFVEYALSQGTSTFLLSWRNPTAEQGTWGLDDYAKRVSDAIDTVREVSGSDDVNVIGFCAGGIITTTLLNHLAAIGDERVHSMSYAVTLLDFDFDARAQISAFSNAQLLRFAQSRSRRKGIISSRQMGAAFTWMRPDDLVWNYWVNNYLMGQKPPAFDVLAWNADGTNLPGALHCEFLDIFANNGLAKAGEVTVLGTPVQLDRIKIPTFAVGAVTDHLTPWIGCYRTTQLLGGESTFVLSYSGHIASLVNPPGNPKAHYWTGGTPGPDPRQWLETAEKHTGSWWEEWAKWLAQHSNGERPAPTELGSSQHPVLEPAPGRYVRDLPPG
ncbi:MAG: alpha/beta fold hydrolase [Pseudonocardia sp.]|nr:alpha/beta fold hydrolase [Pseudonocardia sp.]